MAENAQEPSQMDKLLGTIRFAVIAILIGGGIYFFGPGLLQKASPTKAESEEERMEALRRRKAEDEARKKADDEARDGERRKKIATDALGRIQDHGQEIVHAAFPNRVGAVPFRKARLESVASQGDGYVGIVTLFYTNIFNEDNHMKIKLDYDSVGAFRGSSIGECNDRWATPGKRINIWDR